MGQIKRTVIRTTSKKKRKAQAPVPQPQPPAKKKKKSDVKASKIYELNRRYLLGEISDATYERLKDEIESKEK